MDLSLERNVAGAARGDLMAGRISRLQNGGEMTPDVAAKEMEALFATMLVKELRKGIGEGFFGEGPGADTFNGWFDEQLGASVASRGSLGLGEQVRESMLREQAARHEETERLIAEGKLSEDAE
jgi:Rod binding domain-containing protein